MLSSSLLVASVGAGAFCGSPLVGALQQSRVAAKFPCRRLTAPPDMTMMDLKGKTAFVAGVADSSGYGWAICKALAEAGATVTVGTWPPVLGIFENSKNTR